MAITDADLLDTVRRLRSYMSILDNCHVVLGKISDSDDKLIAESVLEVLPTIMTTGSKVSQTLKLVENSKGYREMVKRYNIKGEVEDEVEEDTLW